jgi:putative alpha-1,2-mannosidase
VRQTTLHLEGGKGFRITARNLSATNCYVKSARLNGRPLRQAWLSHQALVQGGDLVFEMAAQPGDWGTQVLPPAAE